MAKTNTFQCEVITPERAVLKCDATFAAFPAHDGEVGILTGRAPLVFKMGIGPLRVESAGETHVLFVDGGFAQVIGNRLTLLTQQARKASDLQAAAAEQAMVEARAMKIADDASFTARSSAMQRARVQLKLAESC